MQPDNVLSDGLLAHHRNELANGSGISELVIRKNFKSVSKADEIDHLLNRRWSKGSIKPPGWVVIGWEIKNGKMMQTYEGLQVKLDTPLVQTARNGEPRRDANGQPKTRKYESRYSSQTMPLLLQGEDEQMWIKALANPQQFIIVTEGAKKAASGITNGLPTICIPGVTNGQRQGELKPNLAQFAVPGRTFYLAFDNDVMTNPKVRRSLDDLGRLLSAQGSVVKIVMIPPGPDKGMDDFIVAKGSGEFRKLLKQAATYEAWRTEHKLSTERLKAVQSERLTRDELFAKLVDLYEAESDIDVDATLPEIAREAGWQVRDVRELLNSVVDLLKTRDDLEESEPEIQRLLSQETYGLQFDWADIFPESLYKPLFQKSEATRIDVGFYVQTLFAVCGMLLGSKVGVIGVEGSSLEDCWIEYGNLWTATVAPPSSGKSVADSAIMKPLKALQAAEDLKYEKYEKHKNKLIQRWANKTARDRRELEDSEENPDNLNEYNPRVFLFGEGEVEVMLRTLSEQPENSGMMWSADELYQVFGGLDKYKRAGSGFGRKFLLSGWNGKIDLPVRRSDRTRSFTLKGQMLSMTGGLQIKTAKELFCPKGDMDDGDGLQSRFLPMMPPIHPDYNKFPKKSPSLHAMLKSLYEKLEAVDGVDPIRMDSECFLEWQKAWIGFKTGWRRNAGTNTAYSNFLGKMPTNVLRLSVVIHVLRHILGDAEGEDFQIMSGETFKRAVAAARFYCAQFRRLQAEFSTNPDQGLPEFLLKVASMAKERAGEPLRPSEVCRHFRHKTKKEKWNAQSISAMFETIVKLDPMLDLNGKGCLVLKDDNRLEEEGVIERIEEKPPEELKADDHVIVQPTNEHPTLKKYEGAKGVILTALPEENLAIVKIARESAPIQMPMDALRFDDTHNLIETERALYGIDGGGGGSG